MVTMIKCDCEERTGIDINSMKVFNELKKFFQIQVDKEIFDDVSVTLAYYVGYSKNTGEMKWYADKWYRCKSCGTLWEFKYPDFPAQGFVRKIPDGKYTFKEIK